MSHVLVFLARGDKGRTYSDLYDGYPVDWRDPAIHGDTEASLSEHMRKCYQAVKIDKREFYDNVLPLFSPTYKSAEGVLNEKTKGDYRSRLARVDYPTLLTAVSSRGVAVPELSKVRSADPTEVIDLTAMQSSQIFISSVGRSRESGVLDKMLVSEGDFTVGTGGDYATILLAVTDIDDNTLGQQINFSLTGATVETGLARCTKQIKGGLNFNGYHYLVENSVDNHLIEFDLPVGSDGQIKFCQWRSRITSASTLRFAQLRIAGAFTGTLLLDGCRYNSNAKGIVALRLEGTQFIARAWNCVFANTSKSITSQSVWLRNWTPNFIAENCMFYNNQTGIDGEDKAITLRNCAFFGNDNNFAKAANSTSINCATDAASVGAATNTNPQVNAVAADEFVNTTISDTTNGFRLKTSTSTKLKRNGIAPQITGNTADIFNKRRPGHRGLYSIGVSEEPIVAGGGLNSMGMGLMVGMGLTT